MLHSINRTYRRLSPIKKGWLYAFLHVFAAYAAARVHLRFEPSIDAAILTNQFGVLNWLIAKGINKEHLYAHTLYAVVFAPLSVVSWRFFAIDAKPRRPAPKIWHSLLIALYVAPLVAFIRYANPVGTIEAGFKAPALRLIAHSDLLISMTITMTAWLVIGLCYFAILTIWEISSLRRNRGPAASAPLSHPERD